VPTPAFVSAERNVSSVGSACAGAAHTRPEANTPADMERAIVLVRCTPEAYGPGVQRAKRAVQTPVQAASSRSATSMIFAFREAGLSISPATCAAMNRLISASMPPKIRTTSARSDLEVT
jgi:hypothetical protein